LGFTSEFQTQFIFQQTGYLRGIGKIQVITVLMPLICTILAKDANYTSKAYLSFNMMLCDRFNRLLSPKFSNEEELIMLKNLITELVCLHEGLYPICESGIN
jgi:hypothetical protein